MYTVVANGTLQEKSSFPIAKYVINSSEIVGQIQIYPQKFIENFSKNKICWKFSLPIVVAFESYIVCIYIFVWYFKFCYYENFCM